MINTILFSRCLLDCQSLKGEVEVRVREVECKNRLFDEK